MSTHAIIICTRNRADPVRAALDGALANPDTTVVVVDQNLDDRVAAIIDVVPERDRIVHVRTEIAGAGRARNLGMEEVDSEIVCFTDDDCVVPPDYVERFEAALRARPEAGIAFCRVEQAIDRDKPGYAPVFEIDAPQTIESWSRGLRPEDLGIGAGMAVRTAALRAVGGFDPLMGPGSRFPSADDREAAMRLLAAGHHVIAVAEPVVLHYGHRTAGKEARRLTKRDFVAMGAMFAKFTKVGQPRARRSSLAFLFRLFGLAAHDSVQLRRVAGLGKPWFAVVGFVQGLTVAVDPETVTYTPRSNP